MKQKRDNQKSVFKQTKDRFRGDSHHNEFGSQVTPKQNSKTKRTTNLFALSKSKYYEMIPGLRSY